MSKLTLTTLNVRGLGSVNLEKRKKILAQLEGNDIICLQETHSTAENIKFWTGNFPPDRTFFSHGTSNARGSLILLSSKLAFKNLCISGTEMLSDLQGRIAAIGLEVGGEKVGIISCYAPCLNSTVQIRNEYAKFCDDLENILEQLNPVVDKIICVGDFNITFSKKLDCI